MVEEWKQNLDNNVIVRAVLTDLSKAFDFIPHDLFIAKLSAYGLNRDLLCYFYSYLKGRKQCDQINNEQSEFDRIISGVPQGSIFGPILYNILFKDFSSLFQRPQCIILWMIILQPVLKVHRKNYSQFWNQNVRLQLIGFIITKLL